MGEINLVVQTGRLTRDPELRTTESGLEIVKFGLAVNEWISSKKENRANFFEVVAFSHNAVFINKFISKGDLVTVSGRLRQDRWETDSNEKRSKVVIILSDIKAMTKKGDGSNKSDEEYESDYSQPEPENNKSEDSQQTDFDDPPPF